MTNEKIVEKLKQTDLTKYQNLSDLFDMARNMEDYDLNGEVWRLAAKVARERGDLEFYDLYKRSLLFAAPHRFDEYMLYLEFNRDPDKKFYVPRRSVLKSVVDALQDLEDDKLDLVTISMPPGVGKTTLAIFYLTWIMGREPMKPSLASGHSSVLTTNVYNGVTTILDDPVEYLWHDVFPGVQVVDRSAKYTTVDLEKAKRFPTLTCRSIDGSLTGATRCEKLLYSDDLVSGIEEALSKERLDKLWEKYTNDLKSRKKLGCKELHIATRWSVHDPIGRLERMYGDDPRARFIVLPALNEQRESNFDYSHGVGFDTKYFLDMEATLDEVSWRALFMNEPIEREGLLYKADELRRYYELPSDEPDAVLGVCDTAEGGGDYTFLPVAYVYGNDYYIEDCVCDNGLPEVTDALCAEVLLKHNVKQCQFESNSAGGRTADKVQELVKSKGGITHITKKRTTANKLTKIIVNSDFVKKRFLFKDASKYSANSPYGRMMHMMCSFTVTGKNKNDDVPDGLAQLAEYIQSLEGARVEVFKRPF